MKKQTVVRSLVVLGALVLVMGALFGARFWQIGQQIEQMSQPEPPTPIDVVDAVEREWPRSLEAIGSLRAVNGVQVSNEIAGVIESVAFESGQRVEAGDVLVRLDAETDEAALETREAEARLALQQFERFRDLIEQDAVSRSEFDQARANYEAAEARVHEQQALLAKKTIRAPFSGVLGLRQVDLGQFIGVGTPIVGINMLDPIQVDFTLSERDFPRIAVGDRIEVEVAAYAGDRFEGEIIALDSSVVPESRTFRVRGRIDNDDLRLRPGMFANVHAYRGRTDRVVAVPRTAISYNTYGDFVFIVADGDSGPVVERRTVTTGRVRDGEVEVADGLEAGTTVVRAGLLRLRNGQRVRIVADGDGSGDAGGASGPG
jgi:membrane fusion protein (multidrug efflux system)